MSLRAAVSSAVLSAALVCGTTSGAGAQPVQDHAGQYAPADMAYGAQLYTARCAMCHGANGDGVGGVNLASGQFRRAGSDRELTRLITSGISELGMPAFDFGSAELAGIVAYLRNMRSFDAASVPIGDSARGRAVFEGAGECTTCHRVDGSGAGMAPDLGNIGALRTASALQASVLNPTSAMLPINRPIRAVTKNGEVINGRRLNEDTYTVQLIDERGHLTSLVKADISEYTVLTMSPMPAYDGRLDAEQVADLVAYLLSLKGS